MKHKNKMDNLVSKICGSIKDGMSEALYEHMKEIFDTTIHIWLWTDPLVVTAEPDGGGGELVQERSLKELIEAHLDYCAEDKEMTASEKFHKAQQIGNELRKLSDMCLKAANKYKV